MSATTAAAPGGPDHADRDAGHDHAGARHHDRQRRAAAHAGQRRRDQDQISWVLTSYIVASAIFMPLTGFP